MALNSSYRTWERIIKQAMENAGKLRIGQEPTSEDYARYKNRLNDMIGFWQTQGLKLWANIDQSVTLVAGTSTYTLGIGGMVSINRPLRVIQAYYLDTNTNRTPLTALSREEYTSLSNLVTEGSVIQYFWDPQVTLARVSFYNTPDTQAALGTAHLIIQRPITYVEGLLDTIDFPDEWFIALHWGLGDEICTGQPESIVQRCAQRAQTYRQMLEDWDIENASTSMSPNMSGYGAGSFS